MRIAVIGDFHGFPKRSAFDMFLAEAQPDAVLQVGDCQYYEDMPVPFYFVHGNHEDWPTIAALRAGSYVRRHLHYLRDAEPFHLGGLTVVGLGGIPRKNSKKTDSPKFFDFAAYERLSTMGGVDIVLTHDTPMRFRNRGYADLTCVEYRDLAQVMEPRFWFSGHHHHFEVERLGPTTLISLGKWPHEWAVLDVSADGAIDWQRWNPLDQAAYDAKLPAWREREQLFKKELNRAGAMPGRIR